MVDELAIQILPMKHAHICGVAKLHCQGLDRAIVTSLGEITVRCFYQALVESDSAFGFVAIRGEKIVGFISCAENINAFYKYALKRYFFRFVWAVFTNMLSPHNIRDALEKLFHLSDATERLPAAEILAVVVEEQARHMGVGKKLIEQGCDEFRKRGTKQIKVIAGELKQADGFYTELGFELTAQYEHRRRGLLSKVYIMKISDDEDN